MLKWARRTRQRRRVQALSQASSRRGARGVLNGAYCALFLSLTLASAVSHATLLEMDFSAPGDSLLLSDSATGLEWLDLTATTGLSYDDLIAGLGPVDFVGAHDFRFATISEVGLLWSHAGIVNPSGSSSANNRAGVEFLLATMGCTFACGTDGATNQGQAEYDSPGATLGGPFIQLRSEGGAAAALNAPITEARSFASSSLGSYLVRTTQLVPEPSTGILIGLAVAGLALRGRAGEKIRA